MLELKIQKQVLWDEVKEIFIDIPETELRLEHSLISLQKWESKWHKPFFETDEKTYDEIRSYISCMAINKVPDPIVFDYIPDDKLLEVVEYIKDPMTATTFRSRTSQLGTRNRREGITAEIIYYWMIKLGIPMECQKWHLNQLMTLIRVINVKDAKPGKRNTKEVLQDYAAINRQRREMYNSKG